MVGVIFLCKSGRQMNRFITRVMQCVFTKLSGLLKSSRGLTMQQRGVRRVVAVAYPPVTCVALGYGRGSLFFSSHHALPRIPGTQEGVCVCVCVCVASRHTHTHTDNTVRDTQRFKYTHSPEHKDTHTEKGTKKTHRAETVRLLHQNRETPPPATPAA